MIPFNYNVIAFKNCKKKRLSKLGDNFFPTPAQFARSRDKINSILREKACENIHFLRKYISFPYSRAMLFLS